MGSRRFAPQRLSEKYYALRRNTTSKFLLNDWFLLPKHKFALQGTQEEADVSQIKFLLYVSSIDQVFLLTSV